MFNKKTSSKWIDRRTLYQCTALKSATGTQIYENIDEHATLTYEVQPYQPSDFKNLAIVKEESNRIGRSKARKYARMRANSCGQEKVVKRKKWNNN